MSIEEGTQGRSNEETCSTGRGRGILRRDELEEELPCLDYFDENRYNKRAKYSCCFLCPCSKATSESCHLEKLIGSKHGAKVSTPRIRRFACLFWILCTPRVHFIAHLP